MKRKLLFGERMLLGNGKEPFNAVIPFRLKGSFEEAAIQHALFKIQEKHPWLKALIKRDQKQTPWFEVPEKGISIPIHVINRKTDNDWLEESKKQWNTAFDEAVRPLIRFIWIKGESVSDMLLVFHHCICDGGSAMSLLREFLSVLDNPTIDIGIEQPILGIQDVVPKHLLASRGQQLKAKFIGRLAATAIQLIPTGKRAIERQEDYLIHWKFDQGLSKQIINHCKSNGVTVNTFLCAILLQSFLKVRGKTAFNKVSCPVDIRRFAPQIKEDHLFAFGLMIVLSSNKKLSFEDNLRFLQANVDRKTAKLNPYITMMVMESAHDALDNFTKLLKNGKSSNDCMFSNLGRIQIPDQYHTFSLDTIFSPTVIGPLGNTTTLVTSTFRNEMDFSFVASEGYLPQVAASAIRDELNQTIKRLVDSAKAS